MEELAGRIGLAIENALLYQESRRATQARDDVLGIVAHDLRNPLSAIKLASSMLEHQLSREAGGRGLKSVESINRALRRSQRLIDDLMDVTRVEAGKLSVKHEPLAVQQLVYDVVEGQQLLASSNAIDLRIDVDEQLPDVLGDRDRLHQVMENLIGNAVRFTPQGGQITVGAKARAGEVLFSVADTGAGVFPEHLPRLFERFWRAKRDERSGAGLGLPICKGIVEAHGGHIWAESTLHRGTTFYFTIPSIPGVREQPTEPAPTLH
jgi:signal transduction histidine kinase